MNILRIFYSICLTAAAVFGDFLVFKSKYAESLTFRVVLDSSVHAVIGCLSACIFLAKEIHLTTSTSVFHIIFCTLISSAIDIDHVLVARSIYLKDLTGQQQRGIFHCTTFWLFVTTVLLLYSYIYKKINICLGTWMLILAYSSHHIRDGNRRGLWLCPFGSTPPINKYFYVLLINVLPLIFSYTYVNMKPFMLKHTVIDYRLII